MGRRIAESAPSHNMESPTLAKLESGTKQPVISLGDDKSDSDSTSSRLVFTLLPYIFVWYSTSVVCNTSAKKILFLYAPIPLWVTLAQFITTLVVLRVYFVVRRIPLPAQSTTTSSSPVFYKLALVYTLGFVFVNSGYLAVSVSLAETLRSAEPIFSVVLAKLMLDEEYISNWTMATLVPIVLGGVLSSGGDTSFSFSGLLFVCASNVAFALRSVYTKQLKYPNGAIPLFYEISRTGTGMLVGLLVSCEVMFFLLKPEMFVLERLKEVVEENRWWQFITLLVQTGVSYAAYNQMSFLVLSMVSVVTHAVANSFRRIVTILLSVWVFSTPVGLQNALGIVLAISGVVLYSLSKSRDEEERMKARKG